MAGRLVGAPGRVYKALSCPTERGIELSGTASPTGQKLRLAAAAVPGLTSRVILQGEV